VLAAFGAQGIDPGRQFNFQYDAIEEKNGIKAWSWVDAETLPSWAKVCIS
jgi:hypothetical protein